MPPCSFESRDSQSVTTHLKQVESDVESNASNGNLTQFFSIVILVWPPRTKAKESVGDNQDHRLIKKLLSICLGIFHGQKLPNHDNATHALHN